MLNVVSANRYSSNSSQHVFVSSSQSLFHDIIPLGRSSTKTMVHQELGGTINHEENTDMDHPDQRLDEDWENRNSKSSKKQIKT